MIQPRGKSTEPKEKSDRAERLLKREAKSADKESAKKTPKRASAKKRKWNGRGASRL